MVSCTTQVKRRQLVTVLIHDKYRVSIGEFYWNNISVIYIRVINDYHLIPSFYFDECNWA
jgi:hypothetical protein